MRATADVVVIGGGVHGASLAFHLARLRAGKIIVLEKNFLASEPTAKSGAMIRPLFTEAAYIQLVVKATGMFEHWDEYVGGNAGFVQHGFLRITNSLDAGVLGADLDLVRKNGITFEILPASNLSLYVSTIEFKDNEVGVFLPKGAFADPVLTTVGLARAAQRLGVEIREGVEVTAINVEKGSVRSVQTKSGPISTRLVVNCGGAWSRRIAAMVGVELPIQVHRNPTCIFRWPETMNSGGPILSDGVNGVYFRSLDEKFLRAAPFGWAPDPVDLDNYDETIQLEALKVVRGAMGRRFAGMRQTTFSGGFSAVYDMTPDAHPIIDQFPEVEGFWCNCGWSGNGFASAPALGECLAQVILSGTSDIDLSLFKWPRGMQVQDRPDLRWIYKTPGLISEQQ